MHRRRRSGRKYVVASLAAGGDVARYARQVLTTVYRQTRFVLVAMSLASLAGCSKASTEIAETPGDYAPFAVQAGLFVIATSDSTDLAGVVHDTLLSRGCAHRGNAWGPDGSPAGRTYEDLPYLALSVMPERDRRIDVRLYYHRESPDELRKWIDGFREAVRGKPGVKVEVYEEVSTGPF